MIMLKYSVLYSLSVLNHDFALLMCIVVKFTDEQSKVGSISYL